MKKKEEEQDSLFSHVTYWEELRACSKCSSMHPRSHYRHIRSDRKNGYSLRTKCRLCISATGREIYERLKAANLLPDKMVCNSCKEERYRNEFYADKTSSSGVYSVCKSCDLKRHYFHDHSQSNPTQEDFQRYCKATCCECCEQPFVNERRGRRKKCQDHDHDTNVLRGIICSECNIAEGMLKHGSKYANFSDHIRHCVLKYMEKWGVTPKDTHPQPPPNYLK